MISYAQNFEDVLLDRCFRDRTDGFYIDVGAWDPLWDSVTHHFSSKGWSGINVEPSPEWHHALEVARPRDTNLPVALGDREDDTIAFTALRGSGISTLRTLPDEYLANLTSRGYAPETIEVRMTTLARVCRDHVPSGRTIDFLKVDVEGWEAAVLRGNDWDTWRPQVVVVEAKAPIGFDEDAGTDLFEDCSATWEPILLANAYVFAYDDGLNRFYVREESPKLLRCFETPVNCFDQVVHHSAVRCQEQLEKATADVEALEAARGELEQRGHAQARELEAVRAELATRQREVASILASTSWRVTAPLRSLGRLLRRPEGAADAPS